MQSKEMYYIQNYKKKSSNRKGISRFLSAEYMGSAEFEFGSVQAALKFLRENKLTIRSHAVQSKGGNESLVTLYAVSTSEGQDRFAEHIGNHLDGTVHGYKAKDYTGIWEKFNSGVVKTGYFSYADAWLDVSGFMSFSSNNGERNYFAARRAHPIIFTDDKALAIQLFLELMQPIDGVVSPDIHIGDMVHCYHDTSEFKVCGLNEDDSISVKAKYGKAKKMNPRDLWTKQKLLEVTPDYFEQIAQLA